MSTMQNPGFGQMQNEYLTELWSLIAPKDGYSNQNMGGDNPMAVNKDRKWKATDKANSPWVNM